MDIAYKLEHPRIWKTTKHLLAVAHHDGQAPLQETAVLMRMAPRKPSKQTSKTKLPTNNLQHNKTKISKQNKTNFKTPS